jgi:type IV secretion system protein VirD4
VRPFLSKKYDITKHPLYNRLADFDKRNRFDAERFLSVKPVIRSDDIFEVYEIELPEAPPPEAFAR